MQMIETPTKSNGIESSYQKYRLFLYYNITRNILDYSYTIPLSYLLLARPGMELLHKERTQLDAHT